MNSDDPMSLAVPQLFYDFIPNDDQQMKLNCSTTTLNQQLSTFNGEIINPSNCYNVSNQFMVPCWSDGGHSNDYLNDGQSDQFLPQYVPISPPPPPPQPPSPSSSSSVSLSPTFPPINLNDKQLTRETELLQLFESSVFNRLVEDNFIKISLQDEALAVESGLRQLELNKYHELARVVDILYKDHNVTMNNEQDKSSTEQFQITIVHKHTEKLINCVKRITSFTNLCIDDQISLLKSRFIDLCMIKSLVNIEPETRTIKVNGQSFSMEKCHMMNCDSFIKLTISMDPILRADPIINLLILLICLLNPNIANLRSTFTVRKEYILTIHLVQKYLELRGFTANQANCEIKNLICNLEDFLVLFNAKQKVQEIAKRHLGYTSQLIAEMLDINGQHQQHQKQQQQYHHHHHHQNPP